MGEINTEGVVLHAQELRKSPHLQEQVARIMEPLRIIQGARSVRSEGEVVQEVARMIALLEANPDHPQTANVGGVMVARAQGNAENAYTIFLGAVDVFRLPIEAERWRAEEPQ